MTVLFERIAISGVGLIGGSLAKALKGKKIVGEILGVGRNEERLQREQQCYNSNSAGRTGTNLYQGNGDGRGAGRGAAIGGAMGLLEPSQSIHFPAGTEATFQLENPLKIDWL